MLDSNKEKRRFILENTSISAPPHVPEIQLHLADEAHELWKKTEKELNEIGLPPPFWAFAWAGGQGLARFILDTPELVKGRIVLDIASGSGLVAIAAKLCGAEKVIANDIDPFSAAAIRLNAILNNVDIEYSGENLLETGVKQLTKGDVILAGDVFYDREMTGQIWPFLQDATDNGASVLIGDPGRSYLPKSGLEKLASYQVPVTRVLEDAEVKNTAVWRVV